MVIAVISCDSKVQINIKSEYAGKVDSLVYNVNFVQVAKLTNIKNGIDTTIYFRVPNKGKYEYLFANIYEKGKLVDSFFSYNDLNYSPTKTKIVISESLRMKISFLE